MISQSVTVTTCPYILWPQKDNNLWGCLMLIHPSGCSELQLCPFQQHLLKQLRLCPWEAGLCSQRTGRDGWCWHAATSGREAGSASRGQRQTNETFSTAMPLPCLPNLLQMSRVFAVFCPQPQGQSWHLDSQAVKGCRGVVLWLGERPWIWSSFNSKIFFISYNKLLQRKLPLGWKQSSAGCRVVHLQGVCSEWSGTDGCGPNTQLFIKQWWVNELLWPFLQINLKLLFGQARICFQTSCI